MLALRSAVRLGLSAFRAASLTVPAAPASLLASRVTMMRSFTNSAPALLAAAARKTGAAKKPAAKKKTTATKKKAAPKRKVAAKRKVAPKRKTATKRKTAAKKPATRRRRVVLTPEQRLTRQREARQKARRAEIRALPKPPKRSPSAYALFVKETPRIGTENVVDAMKRCSALWKELPLSEKTKYQEQSNALRDVAAAEYRKWAAKVGDETIQKINRVNRAKGVARRLVPLNPAAKIPGSVFIIFFKDQSDKGLLDTTNITGNNESVKKAKKAGELWRGLSAAQKAPYQRLFEERREAYLKTKSA
ncbi:hypothetical protein EXIGLDRAFT_729173 [Exidia glandulosa HHB12029]|uniref:HMG box domain-containing protein n=1 Tax=Exidia glandulosa HHB12029 TaxID=1314781 RepID=A0A165LL92_EXIGL|nr:hypothetical protein EXIGLDRAFT_729173 [Exidia glandulosa HHB12029]